MHGATRVLQEAYLWLSDQSAGELQALNLNSARSVRRVLYQTIQATLRPLPHVALPAGAWLANMLPFQLYVRLLWGLVPWIEEALPEPPTAHEEEASASAASSSSSRPPPPPPPPAPPALETTRTKRLRGEASSSTTSQHITPSASTSSPIGVQRVSEPRGLLLDVMSSGINDAIIAEAVRLADNFIVGAPPEGYPPSDLLPKQDGIFLWNRLEDKPSGPVTRCSGSHPVMMLQRGRWSTLEDWERHAGFFVLSDRAAGMRMASDSLQWWLRARPALRRRLGPPAVQTPPWLSGGEASSGGLRGTWIFFPVDPGPLPGERITGYHGTSLHALARAVGAGLESGWNGLERGGRLWLGVYYHIMERAQYCSNYMMYSPLDRSGHLFSCIVQLSAPAVDPQGRRTVFRTSGPTQNLTFPEVCFVTGVWIHVIHVLHFWAGSKDVWVYAEPRFAAEHELPAEESRESLERRSRTRANQPS